MAGNQCVHPRDEILDAHTLMPREAPRLRHVAAQGHGIFEARIDRVNSNDVAIVQIRVHSSRV